MAEESKNNLNDEELKENEDVKDQNDDKGDSGESGDDKGNNDKSNGNDKGNTKNNGKTFTQDQVTKMMTREKNQGRSAALKELGIDPSDTKMAAMIKTFIDSQKTDDQKTAEKNAAEQSKIQEAEQRVMMAEAKAESMILGVKTQFVDDVVTLAMAKMTEDSDLKTIIGEFKTKYPAWFGTSDEDDDDKSNKKDKSGKAGQKGTGSSVKNADKEKKSEEKGLGARLAAQRKSNTAKASYWGNKK